MLLKWSRGSFAKRLVLHSSIGSNPIHSVILIFLLSLSIFTSTLWEFLLVAQWIEQQASTLLVIGSNPIEEVDPIDEYINKKHGS